MGAIDKKRRVAADCFLSGRPSGCVGAMGKERRGASNYVFLVAGWSVWARWTRKVGVQRNIIFLCRLSGVGAMGKEKRGRADYYFFLAAGRVV